MNFSVTEAAPIYITVLASMIETSFTLETTYNPLSSSIQTMSNLSSQIFDFIKNAQYANQMVF